MRRLLIVEDDADVRSLLGAILEQHDVAYDVAVDGADAIEALSRNGYDGILLDLMLPRIDGTGVLRFMRERQLDVPVIVVSAARHDVLDGVQGRPVVATVTKPFDAQAIARPLLTLFGAPEEALQDKRVLIVDDDADVGAQLRQALADSPLLIDVAYDVIGAVRMLDSGAYCAVVLDLALGDGSGFDVIHHMTQHQIGLPTMVISRKLPSYVREILEQNERINIVCAKPVDAKVLARLVVGLCGLNGGGA